MAEYSRYTKNIESHPTDWKMFRVKDENGLIESFDAGDVIELLPFTLDDIQPAAYMSIVVHKCVNGWIVPEEMTRYKDNLIALGKLAIK